MSTNTKRLLIILVVAAVFCLVGVAAAIGGIGLMADRFKDNITTDSEKVQKMTQAFIKYQLPPGYTEQMGMDFIIYKMVVFGETLSSTTKPIIFLAHFQATEGMTSEQMTQQMQKSVEQQSGRQGIKMKVVETRNVTINGNDTPLQVSEGTDSDGDAHRQWVTTFPGKTGLVILLVQGRVDGWDDAVLNEFLSSLGF